MPDKADDAPDWTPYFPIVTSLVRTVLVALGGAGFAWAKAVTGDQVTMGVSAAMVIVAAGWSAWQKVAAVRALRKAAKQPASAPVPQLPA